MEDDPFADIPVLNRSGDDDPFADIPTMSGPSTATAMGQRGLSPAQNWTTEGTNQDVSKSVLSAGPSLVAGAVGLPGDVEYYAGKAAEYLGGPQQTTAQILPTSEDVKGKLREYTPDALKPYLFHEPKTTMGQVMGTGTEVLAGVAGSPIRMVGAARRFAQGVRKAAPSPDTLADDTRRAYAILDQAGITYEPRAYELLAGSLQQDLKNVNVNTEAGALLNRLTSKAQMVRLGSPVEFESIERSYQEAGDILRNRNSTDSDRKVAHEIRRRLDEFRGNAPMLSGNMPQSEAMQRVRDARDLAKRNIKEKVLQSIDETAKERPEGEYSTHVRQEALKILKNRGLRRNYSRDELDSLREIAKIGAIEAALSRGGPVATSVRQMVAGTAGSVAGGPIGTIAGMATAGGVEATNKGINIARRKKQMDLARALMRAGPGSYAPKERLTTSDIVRALLAGGTSANAIAGDQDF